jgi:hypothetical protein
VCVSERKTLEVNADRNPEDLRLVDARARYQVAHLVVCHLDTFDPVRIPLQAIERGVEFGTVAGAWTTVEIRKADPVRGVHPARPQRTEVVVQEDGLTVREASPRRRSDDVAEPPRCRG